MNPLLSQSALRPGTRVGGYIIEGALGKGGFAFTYFGCRPDIRKRVAIKELFPDKIVSRNGLSVQPQVSDPASMRLWKWCFDKFVQEARILASLRHENIVRVNDLILANNTAYIVMDYVDGYPLDRYIKKLPTGLSEPQLEQLTRQMLNGLETIHLKGILHRDIKPSNIYLTREGRVIFLDFGAAKPDSQPTSSITTIVPFTRGFSPVEQELATVPMTPASDIYSAAATMVWIITGKVPPDSIQRMHHDSYVPVAVSHARFYSQRFLRAVDTAMAIRAELRPQSVGNWRQVFSASSPSHPVPPRPVPRSRPPRPLPSARASQTAVMTAIVVALLACVGLLLWSFRAELFRELRGNGRSRGALISSTKDQSGSLARIFPGFFSSSDPGSKAGGRPASPPSPTRPPPSPDEDASQPAPDVPRGQPPASGEKLLEEVNEWLKEELEVDRGTNEDRYASTVTYNDSGRSGDIRSVDASRLVQVRNQQLRACKTCVYSHLGGKADFSSGDGEPEVLQVYTCERLTHSGEWTLTLEIRLVTFLNVRSPDRRISQLHVTNKVPGYRCRIGPADRLDDRGQNVGDSSKSMMDLMRLLILQDRRNFENGSGRDPEDKEFPGFASEAARRKILSLPESALYLIPASSKTIAAIQQGTPILDVFPEVDHSGLLVRFVE